MLRYPDEQLPELQLSLENFVNAGLTILKEPENVDDFCRAILAGRVAGNGEAEQRIFLNARQGSPSINPDICRITRDYDSALGITRDLPFMDPLAVYPIAAFKDTLRTDVHIYGTAYNEQGEAIKVPLHRVPNIGLGKVRQRHITRIAFPHLYKHNETPAIPQSLLATIYDTAIRPAVRYVVPERLSHWPPNYQAAMHCARDRQQQLHFGSIDLPVYTLDAFRQMLLDSLDSHELLKDAYFIHELRGTKGSTLHNPNIEEERYDALREAFQFLNVESLQPNEWYLDVGLEVYQPDCVLQWMVDGHGRLLRHALPGQDDSDPNSLDNLLDSNRFQVDHVAQLKEFAGFRCVPGSKGSVDGTVYINVYTTDKEPTYQLHAGSFRRHIAAELISGKALLKDVQSMSKVYGTCVGTDTRPPNEGCARFEVRVQLRNALNVLVDLPVGLVVNSITVIPAKLWWQFKFLRLAALGYVFGNFVEASAAARSLHTTLTLGAVSVWMLNALNFRPQEGRQAKDLHDTCCQHIIGNDSDSEGSDDGRQTVPIGYDRGIYFLSDLVTDDQNGAYRMAVGRKVDPVYLAWFYGRGSISELEYDTGVSRVLVPKGTMTDSSRIPNKRKKTTEVRFVRDAEVRGDVLGLRLADYGVEVEPVVEESGRDVDEHGGVDEDGLEDDEGTNNPDRILDRIWNQVPYDIFAVSSNGSRVKDPSHIIMTRLEQYNATWSIFKTTDMSKIFEKAQVRFVTEEFWATTLFDRYFPPKDTRPRERGKLQNFPYTTYYNEWFKFMSQLSEADARVTRGKLLKHFKRVKWLPHGGSDRMWATSKMTTNSWHMYPIGTTRQASPQIAVNLGRWNSEPIVLGVRAAHGEEEEEEEEEEE